MTASLSVQLYSLREESARDFPAVIERLGRIGYAGVEPAGLHGLRPEVVRGHVEDAGMVVSSAHVQPPRGDDADAILDEAEALGARDLVVAFLPPKHFADAEALQHTADMLNESAANARARGLRLGYHNHYWEFSSQIDGRSAFMRLFDLLEPDVFAEVDIYWAQVGGADPANAVAQLGERARLLHVKDGPADDPKHDMVAVGEGVVDVRGVLGAGDSAAWHIVELDRCATDMFEAIERSHAYLVGEGLSVGKS